MSTEKSFSTESFRLNGKTAVITGGASGLGYFYTKAMLASGANIYIVSYDQKGWEKVEELANNSKGSVAFLELDVTDKNAPQQVVDGALKAFGKIDILVNNAGMQRREKWEDYKDADWNAVINLNLNAVYFLSHAVAKIMANNGGGKIINIGSMQSFRAGKYIFPYTASKHGIVGLTKAYADALAPKNIQVNAIAPGYIDTPMTKALQEDSSRNKESLAHIPAQHWADPSELMGTAVFLASPASDYVTGTIIPVDGGYLLR